MVLNYEEFYDSETERTLKEFEKIGITKEFQENNIPFRFDWVLSKCEEGESILDVGCLDGWFSYHADKRGFKVQGTDVSSKAIDMAKKSYPDINFVKGDGITLPFENNSFDVVVATEVLEHVPEPIEFLKELSRVSKKKIILTTPIGLNFDCPAHLHHWFDVIELIPLINRISGNSNIEKIYKDAPTEFKTLFGVVIFDDCRKCGKCCHYLKKGKSVPCKHLKDSLCTIYLNRLGVEIDEGIVCAKNKRCMNV